MKNLNNRPFWFMLLLWVFASTAALAQGGFEVRGVVTSESDGQPLIGATVLVDGKSGVGVVTDVNGGYTLKVTKGDKLNFGYLGMTTKSVEASQNVINVALASDGIVLDEVVAIGYGTVKKKELTGAATQVSGDELKNVISTDVGMSLQGLVSGVSVTSSSGDPGSVANIQIRGITSLSADNTPLFVVDGVPQSGNPNIASSEIQTIDILKDAASCAIYGTRGAAGVILITTKQGEAGKMRYSFDATVGLQQIAYDRLPELMDANEQTYFGFLNNRDQASGDNAYDAGYIHAQVYDKRKFLNNTDVMKMILEEGNAVEQQYNFNMSGGTKELNFSTVLGYVNQDGVVMNASYKKYNMRTNVNYQKGKLKINTSLSGFLDEQSKANGSSFYNALSALPYSPSVSRDITEYVVATTQSWSSEIGAVSNLLRSFNAKNVTERNNFAYNLGVDYQILPVLSFNTKFGINLTNSYTTQTTPQVVIYNMLGEECGNSQTSSRVQNSTSTNQSVSWFGGLNYNQTFNKKHKLAASGIVSYEQYDSKGFWGSMSGVIGDIEVLNGGTILPNTGSNAYSTTRLFGVIGRVQYSYYSRYMLSVSTRADASSKFAPENRWGVFPSVSAGWNVSDEPFWKNKDVVSALKIRGSYGTTGNQSFGSYTYQPTVTLGYDYVFEGTDANYGYTQLDYANADVKWETSIQTNLGFDLSFFKNKLTFTGDFYQTDKNDMLSTVLLPISSGAGTNSLMVQNIGNMTNKGMEFNLSYRQYFKDLFFSASVNYSKNINEILSLGSSDLIYNSASAMTNGQSASAVTVFAKGYEAGAFFLHRTNGVANTPEKLAEYRKLVPSAEMGDLMFVNENDDNEITNDDRVYVGSGLADFEIGFNLNLAWKGIDFATQWFGSYGNEIINGPSATSFDKTRNVLLTQMWAPTNPNSEIPAYRGASNNHANYRSYTDLWLEDGSFLRMKAITLGYTLPSKVTDPINISKVRFFVSGQNLLTFTNYSGMDPEIGGNGLTTRGLDKGGYPVSKKYMFGVKLEF